MARLKCLLYTGRSWPGENLTSDASVILGFHTLLFVPMSIIYMMLPEVSTEGSGGFGRGCAGDREGAWYWGSGSAGKSKIWSALRGWSVNVLQWGYSCSTPDALPLESPPTSNGLGDLKIGLLLCFEDELSGH